MLTPEITISFAQALVSHSGNCTRVATDRPIGMACSQCPFFCLGELSGSRRIALDKAKNYLDIYVRNIIEKE